MPVGAAAAEKRGAADRHRLILYRECMGENHQTSFIGKVVTHKQHYVPRFFLKEFTDDKTRFAVLHDGRVRGNMTPANVGFEKDLYETPATPDARDGMMLAPNVIENALSAFENRLACEYRKTLEKIIDMRPSDADDETIGRICSTSSLLVASLIVRSPEYLDKTIPERQQGMLERMKRHGLGTPEELSALLRDTIGEDAEGQSLPPEQIADHLARLFTVVPFAIGGVDRSDMLETARTLCSECSFLFLTTCAGHPFIGLSAPYIITDNTDPTLVFPLSSRVCMICTADGQHTFHKQSISNRTLRMMNQLLLNADINGFKFCEREDYLHTSV